jgi:fibrillarin-like pre-rRNA processing protein
MRAAARFEPSPASPRLRLRRRADRTEFWTETVGALPEVYGERWASDQECVYRSFDPARSKLSAALARGWDGPLPVVGERWLYLGAASGTTASHVADLLGPTGRLYAVERSVRPFVRLVAVAERWPNLLPVLGDARMPETYAGAVPLVDGIYADVAQPDQVPLVLANALVFLKDRTGAVVIALKTSSMGRERGGPAHLRAAEEALGVELALAPSVRLDPFYRSHYLVGGRRGGPPPPVAARRVRDRPSGRRFPRRAR